MGDVGLVVVLWWRRSQRSGVRFAAFAWLYFEVVIAVVVCDRGWFAWLLAWLLVLVVRSFYVCVYTNSISVLSGQVVAVIES